ncbi:CoA transferase [Microbacterium sp.]|uniref:CoA transferase n=1 Tax=Microbacterium sp. TaxID=51671 RepID=UPI0039E2E1DE
MDVPLASRLSTAQFALSSVSAFATAAGIRHPLDPERIAIAYQSDRVFAVDGAVPEVWSAYSRFWECADGWMRTHGNYPHHARRLIDALGVGEDPADIERMLRETTTDDAVARITSTRGLAVAVSPEDEQLDAALRSSPLVTITRHDSEGAPHRTDAGFDGVRVLDLTRVIAGPVCTRSLALLGADVLRIDPPHLPEPEYQHFDTGHGKRSALLDAHSPVIHDLLDRADVVVVGYRPAALTRLGLAPEQIIERHPGLIVAQLSAWGVDEPDRAGFDSLVQAESGIALAESPDGVRPGALPAQALDHSAGYLLAAAVLDLLGRRGAEGGSWIARTSLRRMAAELLGLPRRDAPAPLDPFDPAAHAATFDVAGHKVTTARPAVPGVEFRAPRPWGGDQPRW